jgi:hypothetical protein
MGGRAGSDHTPRSYQFHPCPKVSVRKHNLDRLERCGAACGFGGQCP